MKRINKSNGNGEELLKAIAGYMLLRRIGNHTYQDNSEATRMISMLRMELLDTIEQYGIDLHSIHSMNRSMNLFLDSGWDDAQ